MDDTFEIMFHDLKPEIQKEFLEFMGMQSEKEGNFDTFSIADVPKPTDDK